MTTHKSHTFLLINFLSPPFFVLFCDGMCCGLCPAPAVLQWISQLHLLKGAAERRREIERKREEGKERERTQEPLESVSKFLIFKMQHIYMHSHEHFEVFTTVLAPQGEWNHVEQCGVI